MARDVVEYRPPSAHVSKIGVLPLLFSVVSVAAIILNGGLIILADRDHGFGAMIWLIYCSPCINTGLIVIGACLVVGGVFRAERTHWPILLFAALVGLATPISAIILNRWLFDAYFKYN